MTQHSDEIALSTDLIFETAGGFEFTDSLAVGLDRRWREQSLDSVVPVSVMDLAWLIEGYVRARRMHHSGSSKAGEQ